MPIFFGRIRSSSASRPAKYWASRTSNRVSIRWMKPLLQTPGVSLFRVVIAFTLPQENLKPRSVIEKAAKPRSVNRLRSPSKPSLPPPKPWKYMASG